MSSSADSRFCLDGRFKNVENRPRFVDITNRLNKLKALGGGIIAFVSVASTWGHWRTFGIVVFMVAMTVGFNVGYNIHFMARMGKRGEMLRSLVNTISNLGICHLAGWPVSQWLVLPFLALVSEYSAGRHMALNIALVCLAHDAFALLSGVPWFYPLFFTAGAWFCYVISTTRFSVITDMLNESDAQRIEVEKAHARLRAEVAARERMELELRQAQKLEAVGRLAAGVAHEINTPVQFVNDSVSFMAEAFQDTWPLVQRWQAHCRASLETRSLSDEAAALVELEDQIDLPYLMANVPSAAARSLEGLQRIATIVRSLKEFAHPDQTTLVALDLDTAIRSTLVIASHEYKLVADVETHFSSLPPIACCGGEINQVVLNIIVNAAHAISDVVAAGGARGKIGVSTRLSETGHDVIIEISDTGAGIPVELHQRIFDPFFTTKAVGKGTGQGLAIARAVVEKHGGKLTFESEVGRGTTFFVCLPVNQPASLAA